MFDIKKLVNPKKMPIDELITNLEPWLITAVQKTCPYFQNMFDDYLQIARLAVIDAVKTFNPKKKTKFSSFLFMVVGRKLKSEMKRIHYSGQGGWDNQVVSLNAKTRNTKKNPNHEKDITIGDTIYNKDAPLPYDNLKKIEEKELLKGLIDLFYSNKFNRKTAKGYDLLVDYFVNVISSTNMKKLYGPRYDNIVKNFKNFVKRFIKENNIKLPHMMDRAHIVKLNNRSWRTQFIKNKWGRNNKLYIAQNLPKSQKIKTRKGG